MHLSTLPFPSLPFPFLSNNALTVLVFLVQLRAYYASKVCHAQQRRGATAPVLINKEEEEGGGGSV